MSEEKRHWKKDIDVEWIGTYILPESKDINVKLTKVEFKKDLKVAGKKKDQHIAHFEQNKWFDKPMLLNRTNLKRLTMLLGTPYYQDWGNVWVTLTQEMDKTVTGGTDWALRIKPALPKMEKDELTKEHPKYEAVVTFLKGGGDINNISQKYAVSKELFTELSEIKKDEPTK